MLETTLGDIGEIRVLDQSDRRIFLLFIILFHYFRVNLFTNSISFISIEIYFYALYALHD